MATDPSGIFTLPPSTWVETGDTVLPEQHNPAMLELEQGMTDRLMRDGRAPMTGNLRMGDNKITGLADGTSPSDAAALHQIAAAFKAWLTSVNKLDLAANEMVYASGANTAAKTALTGYARLLFRAENAAAARDTLNINKGIIDSLGINATSVGGITPEQIARTDRSASFEGSLGVISSVNVRQGQSGANTHLWFRDTAGGEIGLFYRRGSDGAIVLRRYKTPGGEYEEALLLPGGTFSAPAFRGDGRQLTNLPITKALIDALGINASSVGGITPGQIARTDQSAAFDGDVGAIGSVNVRRSSAGGNTHLWFRDQSGAEVGLIFQNGNTNSLNYRTYASPGGAYKEARLLTSGVFQAEAFQGDGSRLTNVPQTFAAGYTIRNLTGSRANNTTYRNNTGAPLEVYVIAQQDNGDTAMSFYINESQVYREIGRSSAGGQENNVTCVCIVGPNDTYRATVNPGRIIGWHERSRT